MLKYQAILKNNKNGHKLFNTPQQAIKAYPNQILKLIEVQDIKHDRILTGARNNRGKQYLNRKDKLNRIISI